MNRVGLLVNFSKEFLIDRGLDQINENIFSSLKEEVLILCKSVSSSYETFFEAAFVSDEEAELFAQLDQELARDVRFLLDLSPRNRKGQRWRFIDKNSSDEDEPVSEQNSMINSLETLKSLIAKLENQATYYASTIEKTKMAVKEVRGTKVLPRSFYESLVRNYTIVNKNFLYNVDDSDFFNGIRPQLNKIRSHIYKFQQNCTLIFLRLLVNSHSKALKTMNDIASLCLFLYGKKIVSTLDKNGSNHHERTQLALQSISPILREKSPSSVEFSKHFSKIPHKRVSINLESFCSGLSNFIKIEEAPEHLASLSDEKLIRRTPKSDSRTEKQRVKEASNEKFDHLAGRCFCSIF
jgi:hypothetical protein